MPKIFKLVNKFKVVLTQNTEVLEKVSLQVSDNKRFLKMSSDCIFCKIIAKESPGEILYEDDQVVVFKDIKPASTHHYLAVPKQHIVNINHLNSVDHKNLLLKLTSDGKKVLEDNGGDVNDVRLGFHNPPFNSVSHLHLHVISPTTQMSFLNDLVFKPNTWWFHSVDRVLDNLDVDNTKSKI